MQLYSWNVNGLRACLEKGFCDFLQQEAPDVLCLQETKMLPEQWEGQGTATGSTGIPPKRKGTPVRLFLPDESRCRCNTT